MCRPMEDTRKECLAGSIEVGGGRTSCANMDGKRDKPASCLDLVEVHAGDLCLGREVTSVGTIDQGRSGVTDTSLEGGIAGSSTRA